MSRALARHVLHLAAVIASAGPATAFVSTGRATANARSLALAATSFSSSDDAVADAKSRIGEAIADTDRGRSMTSLERPRVHSLLSDLEALCPLSAPARDPRMEGPWIVEYTDAPPPSNGQLGFLKGVAKQVIALEDGRYRNELYVGGNGPDGDEGAWLSAVLDAAWEEWDGAYLDDDEGGEDDDGAVASGEEDPGATTWKVDFESLTLSAFGVTLFTQQFKAGTSRTWKMTYLDDDSRIVRAGKTGRGEDDWLFYMRRGS